MVDQIETGMAISMHLSGKEINLVPVCLCLCLAGCTSPRAPANETVQAPIVWPAPPAQPRVAFLRDIATPRDFGIRPSVWQVLVSVFAGSDITSKGFVRPVAVAFDANGDLCIADPGQPAVSFFDRAGGKFRRWTRAGKIDFVEPVGISKVGDSIFVADSGLGAVLALDPKGKLKWTASKQLVRPTGLAVLGDSIVVSDTGSHRITVLNMAGGRLFQFGRHGTGPGEFNFPTHVAVDAGDSNSVARIYVTDAMNHRIQAFDPTGRFVGTMGSIGDSSGHLSKPKGIAVDSRGHVYVVDALFDNIQIFDRSGRFLMHWGSAGTGAGEFWLPAGIAIRNNGEIIVADSYNRRLQSFRHLAPKHKTN